MVYQSQPGYYVTASLFIPAGLGNKKAPAIIYCSGHSDKGYRTYQQVLLNLVKKGLLFLPLTRPARANVFNT
ncbi:hypothetical protein KRR40_40490 [Niabella defluvii]|nr:hypothetical protein KRR40_40490 [Niabella sp. I65]